MDDLVSLEAYTNENRTLIHDGRNDEAIAICKYLLHYYPKHVDSYRQLGEAYLEKGELDSAEEMFRRVLSADPENVIAYVGLATVFEQGHLIDEAVWHLERAYEIAPGNFEIHKELVHLYSEAGKPRQRLKLTPGGLARLYAQEGLYFQAIQELRAIATATPSRFDARVALAETLWHAGRIREAAEVAQGILIQLPYCLKANLILGTAWKESGLPESETYLSHAQELDPTNTVAQRLLGQRSPLPVVQGAVPRYVEGRPPPPMPTLLPGIQPATGLVSEVAPATEAAEPPPPVEAEVPPMPRPDLTVQLPPWLHPEYPEPAGAGLQTPMAEAKPGEETALPSWLTTQPPTESAETAPTAEIAPEEEKLPAWMEGPGETGEPPPPEAPAGPVQGTATNVPDWLRDLQTQTAPAQAPPPPEPAAPSDEYALPDFLAQPPTGTKLAEAPPPEPAAPSEEYALSDLRQPSAETKPAEEHLGDLAEIAPPPPPAGAVPAAGPVEPTPKRKRVPKGYSHLVLAREHRDANRIDEALVEYDYLVQHAPRLVTEVIDDLEVLTAREDTPLEAHRILGDAYTRADRLAEALKRYQFVLERTPDPPLPSANP